MIEAVLTLDYEIYGNGRGSLRDLIYEPAERLGIVAGRHAVPLVVFVEAAELEAIEARGADPAIGRVKDQLRVFRDQGFEIGLHLHPQWFNARYENGEWALDMGEYNLCTLGPDRIDHIVGRSIAYLRGVLADRAFSPVSFRAGNWLLQPTGDAARVLVRHGIKIDSSVFKGGLQHQHGLDYRRARRNGYYWPFSEDVNVPDPRGELIELPTLTEMVPLWKIITPKRIGLQQKAPPSRGARQSRLSRLRDYARFRQPMKLDFCRLTPDEMIGMIRREMSKDRTSPAEYRPLVAIGHTKDLAETETIDRFLSFLGDQGIPVATLEGAVGKIRRGGAGLPGRT